MIIKAIAPAGGEFKDNDFCFRYAFIMKTPMPGESYIMQII